MSSVEPVVRPTVEPRDVYGRAVLVLGVISVILSVILLTCAALVDYDAAWRSITLGVGLVVLSTGLTVLVSVLMYRVAPAATAPALALLYLLKVVFMGWFLLSVGAPEWLHSTAFAISVAVGLVLSWLALAPVALRASSVLASDYAAVVRAQEAPDAAAEDGTDSEGRLGPSTTLKKSPRESTEGAGHE